MPRRLSHGPTIGELRDRARKGDREARAKLRALADELTCSMVSGFIIGHLEIDSETERLVWSVPSGGLGDDQEEAMRFSTTWLSLPFLLGRMNGWKRPKRGRPPGSGTFRDAKDYVDTMRALTTAMRQQGQEVTQETLAEYFAYHGGPETCSDRQIRQWNTAYSVNWQDLKEG